MKTVEGYRLRAIGKDYVLMPEGSGAVNYNRMIAINSSAAYLWENVEGKEFDVDTLRDLLLAKYDVDAALADNDAHKLIEAWKEAGIIRD